MDKIKNKSAILSLFLQKRFQDALNLVERKLKLNSKNINLWLWKGFLLWILKRNDEAIIYLNKAIELDPQNDVAFMYKANVYESQFKFNQAINCLNKALKINPNSIPALIHKARSLQSLRKNKEAIKLYKIAINIHPCTNEWIDKAMIEYKIGKLKEAIKSLESFFAYMKEDDYNERKIKKLRRTLDEWKTELKNNNAK